jgi:hypothetical protein
MIPGEQVEQRPDGYLLFGAELVPHAEAMPSPDGARSGAANVGTADRGAASSRRRVL